MFRKLQVKFIAMIMATVTLILVALFTTISIVVTEQVSAGLSEDMNFAIGQASEPSPRSPGPPRLERRPDDRTTTPIAVYTLADGTLTAAPRTGITVDASVLAETADVCANAPDGEGSLPSLNLVFLKRTMRDTTYVAFAHDTVKQAQQSIVLLSFIVGIAALAIFFVCSIFFSRWALKPVRRAWDQQRMFVANASHDLKTPLSIIKANTEVLLDEPDADADARSKWLLSTRDSVEDMQTLVNDMLALSVLDAAEEKDSRKTAPKGDGHDAIEGKRVAGAEGSNGGTVDLSRLAERNVLQFESRAFESGFQLTSHIEAGLFAAVDAAAVTRIVQILLDNACKYVGEGGDVTVGLERVAESAVLTVSNTGPCIPPEKLDHIFERFYRVDDARTATDGHGLGLAIAHSLADAMDARLSVTSRDDLTTFTLMINHA